MPPDGVQRSLLPTAERTNEPPLHAARTFQIDGEAAFKNLLDAPSSPVTKGLDCAV